MSLLVLGLVFLCQLPAAALQNITLMWDPSPDPNVIGYYVYYGTASRTYTTKLDAGNATNITITGLVEGTTYYFAATAYNAAGLESDPSNEVSYTVPLPNQPPTLNALPDLAINEDAPAQIVNLAGITAGGSNEVQTLSVAASSSNPGLIPNPTVSYTSPNTTGTLTFTPTATASGSAILSVTVNDGQTANNTITRTFTVTVNAVNDPPTLADIGNLSISENAPLQTVSLSGISSGAANEVQALVVTATSSDTSIIPNPTVSYTSPNATAALNFTPVPYAFGSAVITVSVNDGAPSNNIVTKTFTVSVGPVNQPPTLAALSNLAINEDAGPQTVNLTGISSGASNEIQTLSVTASSGNPALIPNPTVTYTSPNTTGTLVFAPVTSLFGSAVISVTVNDGQSASNTITRTFTVTVNAVNDTPTLNQLADLSLNEDAPLQTVNLSGITSGATNEAQNLVVTATSSDTRIIPNPAVTYTSPNTTGTLTFTPVPNAFGSAVVTVSVNDGQASNNVITRTFAVTINAVNDPPTLNNIGNLNIAENASLQTVNLSGITSGATNEAQALVVTATSSDITIIPNPTVNYTSPNSTGTLTFTPVLNAFGSAVVTVSVDDGQPSNNIVTKTFTVAVGAVNQRPTLDPLSNVAINEDAGPQSVNLTGIGSGAINEVQTLSVTAISSNPAVISNPTVTYTSPNTSGILTFAPITNAFGSATIAVTVNDGQTTNNAITRTFVVTVNAVNDPPTLNSISDFTVNQAQGQTITVSLAGIGSGATNESQTLAVTAGSSNPALIPSPVVTYSSPAATGSLRLAPVSGASGVATITVTVSDGQPTNNTVTREFKVTINSPPVMSAISNAVTAVNTPTPPIAFSIGDVETPAANLLLDGKSLNLSLVQNSNIVFSGSGNNRTVTVTPSMGQAGTASISVSVSDGYASVTNTFQLSVQAKPVAPANLQLVIDGSGTVTSSAGSKQLVAGQTYTLTAVAGVDQEFAGWSGSLTSSSPKLTFVMTTNVVLKAKFIRSPYIPAAGSFAGLFFENDQVRQGSSGCFSLSVTRKGSYSGRLQFGQSRYAFTGKLALDCQATNVIKRSGTNWLNLQFLVGSGDTSGQVEGRVTDGSWIAGLSGERATYHSYTNPAPYVGRYTLLLPGQDSDDSLPMGHGYGRLSVNASGRIVFSATLGDGTKVSQSIFVSKHGLWPLYVPISSGKGSVLSWLTFSNQPSSDISGALSWIKPATLTTRYYPLGFALETTAIGSAYVPPLLSTEQVLNCTTATVAFTGGNLGGAFSNSVAFGPSSRVTNLCSNRLSMTFSRSFGTFAGSVTDPYTLKTRSFGGVVLQKLEAGYGTLMGTNQTGQVTLLP